MTGLVWTGELEVRDDIELRGLRSGEVRVRIEAAGLCHSDVSVVNGNIPFPTPVVLGHEGAGVVDRGRRRGHQREGGRPRRPDHARQLRLVRGLRPGRAHPLPLDDGSLRAAVHRRRREGVPVRQHRRVLPGDRRAREPGRRHPRRHPVLQCVPGRAAASSPASARCSTGPRSGRARSVVVIGTGGIGLNVLQGASHRGRRSRRSPST